MINCSRFLGVARVLALALILAAQLGCATNPPITWPAATPASDFGNIAIVPAQYPPNTNFYVFAEGMLAGAKKSAASGGTAAVLTGGAIAGISTVLVPWAAPVWIIGGVITAVAGATAATVDGAKRGADMPPEKAHQMKTMIADAVARLNTQESLAAELNRVAEAEKVISTETIYAAGPKTQDEKPDYRRLKAAGVDTALEVGITEMGFLGCGRGFTTDYCWDGSDKPQIFLFIKGEHRLVQTVDATELQKSGFYYQSAPHEFADWVSNDAQLLADELEIGYGAVAQNIHDKAFLLIPFDLPVPSLWYPPFHELGMVCWLYPVSPQNQHRIASLEGWREAWKKSTNSFPSPVPKPPFLSALMFSPVDSLAPELRWSGFPRDFDQGTLDQTVLNNISEVTYDLRVWDAVRGSRGSLVYERNGLKEPQHRLEEPLKPDSHYFWSVRARFSYQGRVMTTRWALIRPGVSLDCNADPIPDSSYYRFRTPKEDKPLP